MNKDKIFYIDIDINDNITGMDAIALVDNPAVKKNFLCFSEDKIETMKFNSDEHIITGVVCLADTPIYRKSGDYEYYVVFSKEVIKKLMKKYSMQGFFNSVNLQHNNDWKVEDAYMIESYVIDQSRGIVPEEFKDIPDGSWIVSYYINNDALWDELKNNNNFNGFSLQGSFELVDDYISEKMNSEDKPLSFDQWIESYL